MIRINLATDKQENRMFRALRRTYRSFEIQWHETGCPMWAGIKRWRSWRFGRAIVGDKGSYIPMEARFYGPLVRVKRIRA